MSRAKALAAPVVLAAVCMATPCTGSAPGGTPPDATYASAPCPRPNIAGVPDLDFPPDVQCGYLTVPENRANPNGRKTRIFVARAPENANLTTEDAALATARSVLPQFPDPVQRILPEQGRMFTECPVWDVGKAGADAKAPTVSDLPVLIMEGDFDAATAPGWVDLVTPTLGSSQLVEFPFTGHAVLPKSTCALSTMTAFLDNPSQPVDRTCAAQTTLTFTTGWPPARWASPPTPGHARPGARLRVFACRSGLRPRLSTCSSTSSS